MADVLRTLDEPGRPTLHTCTASDGYIWHYRRFAAPGPVIARVVFLHGIQSHGGWYPRSCAAIAAAGYEVFFLDRRGSGLNSESRGDAPSFRVCLDDIAEFLRSLPTDRPRFLAAISWGGKLGVALEYRHPGLIDGLALIGPGFFPNVRPGFIERLRIARSAFRNPTRRFPIPLNDPALFTASAEGREFIRSDPLALHTATARLLFQSAALDLYLRRAWKRVAVPTLLLLAGEDLIIDNAKTRAFIERFRVPTQVIEYPAAHHTLEFEPAGPSFVADFLAWLTSGDA